MALCLCTCVWVCRETSTCTLTGMTEGRLDVDRQPCLGIAGQEQANLGGKKRRESVPEVYF